MATVDTDVRPVGIDTTKAPEPEISREPIGPKRYYDRGFWEREWEGVWTRTWQIVALERQLQKTGDFVTMEFGTEVIIAIKGEDGKIRCFYNVCQHRGMLLVAEEVGNMRRLTCPYHAWSYNLRGQIKTIPDEPDFAPEVECRERYCPTENGLIANTS